MRAYLPLAVALVALAGCSQKPTIAQDARPPAVRDAAEAPAPEPGEPLASSKPDPNQPVGLYALDPQHTTVLFRVSHLGFSAYTAGFSKISGGLQFDPAKPEASALSVAIDTRSLTLPSPPPGFHDTLTGPEWLDAGKCPQITFKSTKIERTGPAAADVTGDLTVHCVTKPVTLQARFNGGYPPNAYDGARIGFSGKTSFKRSDFGVAYGLPAAGTNMGVGDRVDVAIESEFAMPKPPAPATNPQSASDTNS
jgi:polyisoprenoid-binding protein YceI